MNIQQPTTHAPGSAFSDMSMQTQDFVSVAWFVGILECCLKMFTQLRGVVALESV